MKPILLTISGWGPYKEIQTIDFTQFQERGIFLITGATGAGKTTVFDAITYALYGNVSGNMREKDSVRSDFAEEQTLTYVELIMEHGQENYRIYRNPEYVRPKKRKSGKDEYTKEKEKAVLYLSNGTVVEGNNEVTRKIEEVLHMDYRQFKQISMIAQGEFTKLLTANQKEKTEIFRELFNTFFYERFAQTIKRKSLELYAKIMTLRNKMEETIEQTALEDKEEWKCLTQEKPYHYAAITEYLKEEKIRQKKEVKVIENRIEKNEEILTELLRKMEEGKHENLLFEKREDAQRKYEQHLLGKKDYDAGKQALVGARKAQGLQTYETVLEGLKKQRDESAEKIGKMERELRQLQEEGKQMEPVFLCKNQIEVILREIQEYRKQEKEWEEQKKDFLNKENLLQNSQIKYVELEENVRGKREEYQKAEESYKRAVVGVVARLVVEGKPCPVCGSLTHPKVADMEKEVLKEDELEKLKEDFEKLNGILMECFAETAKIKGEVTTLKTMLGQREKDILRSKEKIDKHIWELDSGYAAIDKQLENCISDWQKGLSQSPKDGEQILLRFQNAIEAENRRKTEIEEKEKFLKQLQADWKALETESGDAQKLFAKKLDENQYTSREAYEADKRKTAQIDVLSQAIAAYEQQQSVLEDYKRRSEEDVIGKVPVSLEKLILQLEEAETKKRILKADYSRIKIIESQVQTAEYSLREKLGKAKELEKEYGIIGDLDNLIMGKNSKRLVFEQYVLSGYFDSVLEAANIRLFKMTSGRYELFRAQGSSDGRKKDNLEIEVFDNYTGKYRSIKTLSGGETFNASLSLALGMSDMIQGANGGILVETLFIDEGFGALDEQSLEQACETLMDLAEKKKLIGIISHVQELKERIDNQVVIEKTNAGSKIHLSQG